MNNNNSKKLICQSSKNILELVNFQEKIRLPKNIPGESTGVLIAYVENFGWQLTTLNDGCIYTPKSYKATFGILPLCPKGFNKRITREWSHPPKKYRGFTKK